jgi:hypothetical protein
LIEVNLRYDLLPGVDQHAYIEWAKKGIRLGLKAQGIVEARSNRNLLGSPQVRATYVWERLADWAVFAEGQEWQALISELRRSLGTNVSIEIWGPSPVAPESIRPAKRE